MAEGLAAAVTVTEVGWVENQEVLKLRIASLGAVIAERLISLLDAVKREKEHSYFR